MPAFDAASISTRMLKALREAMLIGPVLTGLMRSVQICELGVRDSDVLNRAAIAPTTSGRDVAAAGRLTKQRI